MEFMEHHFEHHFVTNSDNIDHVKAKLDAREDSAMNKIGELEVLVKKVKTVYLIFTYLKFLHILLHLSHY